MGWNIRLPGWFLSVARCYELPVFIHDDNLIVGVTAREDSFNQVEEIILYPSISSIKLNPVAFLKFQHSVLKVYWIKL